jgi:hypothetical protein
VLPPLEPLVPPVDPVEPLVPPDDPLVPPVEPVDPLVPPDEPVDPVDPLDEPLVPPVDPVEPLVPPLEPLVPPEEPVVPPVDPVDPVDPVVPWVTPVVPAVEVPCVDPVDEPDEPDVPPVESVPVLDPVVMVVPVVPVDPVVPDVPPVEPLVPPEVPSVMPLGVAPVLRDRRSRSLLSSHPTATASTAPARIVSVVLISISLVELILNRQREARIVPPGGARGLQGSGRSPSRGITSRICSLEPPESAGLYAGEPPRMRMLSKQQRAAGHEQRRPAPQNRPSVLLSALYKTDGLFCRALLLQAGFRRWIQKRLPPPGRGSTPVLPRIRSTARLTIARPIPVPG